MVSLAASLLAGRLSFLLVSVNEMSSLRVASRNGGRMNGSDGADTRMAAAVVPAATVVPAAALDWLYEVPTSGWSSQRGHSSELSTPRGEYRSAVFTASA